MAMEFICKAVEQFCPVDVNLQSLQWKSLPWQCYGFNQKNLNKFSLAVLWM